MKKWYVVRSKHKQEQVAVYNLFKQGYNSFLPLQSKVGKRGDVYNVALFPNYLFVEFDIEVDRWKKINSTRGVSYLLSVSEDSASAVPVGFVEELIAISNNEGVVDRKDVEEVVKEYAPGTELDIVDGIFKGLSGTCVQNKKGCVTLFLSLLSGKTRVYLKQDLVRPTNL